MKYTVTENLLVELYKNKKQKEELDTRLKQQFKKNSYGDYICIKNNDIRIEVNEEVNTYFVDDGEGREYRGTMFELYDKDKFLDWYKLVTTAMEEGLNHIENF